MAMVLANPANENRTMLFDSSATSPANPRTLPGVSQLSGYKSSGEKAKLRSKSLAALPLNSKVPSQVQFSINRQKFIEKSLAKRGLPPAGILPVGHPMRPWSQVSDCSLQGTVPQDLSSSGKLPCLATFSEGPGSDTQSPPTSPSLRSGSFSAWELNRSTTSLSQIASERKTSNSSQQVPSKLGEMKLKAAATEELYQGVLPGSVEALDYFSAADFFDMFDSAKSGHLDRAAFYRLMQGITRDKENANQKLSDAIFDHIDIEGSGGIDKEEFLAWVFQVNNNYLDWLRKKLSAMSIGRLEKLFQQIDKNEDGFISDDEFWNYLQSVGCTSREASDNLHWFINGYRFGTLDLDEFLNWIHTDRELELLRQERDGDESQLSLKQRQKNRMKPLPKKPVVLQFTIGKDYIKTVATMNMLLAQVFTSDQIRCEYIDDPSVPKTCTKVVAKVGRGIELWERSRMMAFKEDPFVDKKKIQDWIRSDLYLCVPEMTSLLHFRAWRNEKTFTTST